MSDADWAVPMLTGRHVQLVPLDHAHAHGLARAAADGEVWSLVYTSVPAPGTESAYIEDALAMRDTGDSMPFAVLDAQGDVVGSTRYYMIDRSVPRLHIGYTWYASRVQRTALNTEAKRLLLGHAFDVLGCEVVVFETSHLNLRSQAAIQRLGAKPEGVLRAHMRHRDGSLRDTHSFSIVRAEWPDVRARLDARMEQPA
ncbi:GNAT family N-acetyltransferase [Lysobacter sp. TY2-98]|uniref:GNAT family N-acetyltransferase n=1 Tax=Lysobacter sp. TY2-98 TaxID=2290922 RepID=UPI001F083367|nr:GNAT family N-acetyltransferase [Lysobacter sp. TY2-98]